MFIFKVTLHRYGNPKDSIIAFTSKSGASLDPTSGILVTSEQDFFDNYMFRNEDFVSVYNSLSLKERVKRFADRKTAVKRTWNLFTDLAARKLIEVRETISTVKNLKQPKGKRGRKSIYEGKRIILRESVEKNPRRRFSHGFNSFEIVLKHKEILYEKYIQLGGRRQDLAWDLYMKRVKVIR